MTNSHSPSSAESAPVKRKPILCLDFDGVLHSYSSGWKGADKIPDPPTAGAMMFLHHAVHYFDVQIYSSRSGQPGGIQAMRDWLNYNLAVFYDCSFGGAPDDFDKHAETLGAISFPTSKPAAFVTIDDRALCFTGNWADFYPQDLLEFQPWNKKSTSPSSRTIASRSVRLIQRIRMVLNSI